MEVYQIKAAVRRASRGSPRPLLQRLCEDFRPRFRRPARPPARAPRQSAPARACDSAGVVLRGALRKLPRGEPQTRRRGVAESLARALRGASARAGRARMPTRRTTSRRAAFRPGQIRAGHALRAICSPIDAPATRGRSPSFLLPARSARAPAAPRRRSAPASSSRSPGTTSTSWLGSNGRADAAVAVISVCPSSAQPLRQRAAPALVELREHVVEQEQRRRRPAFREQLRLREQEREHGQPLLSLRAVAAEVAPAGRDPDVVQMRPEPGRAPVEILVEPRLESLRASAARPRRAARPPASPSSAARSANGGSSAAITSCRAATSAAPSSATRCVQGSTASRDDAPNVTLRSAAFR